MTTPINQSHFRTTTASRYYSLKKRVRKFYKMPNLELPYSVEDYRFWVRTQLGDPSGTTVCAYCGTRVNFLTMITEHHIPLQQRGALTIDNLCVACAPCNDQKGCMMPQAFHELRLLGLNRDKFTEVDWDNLRGRLQNYMKLAKNQQAALRERQVGSVRLNPAGRITIADT